MARLFVAAWPSDAVVAQLRALPRPDDAPLRWTEPAQWHVTLRFFGNVADDDVPQLVDTLRSVRSPAPRVVAGPTVETIGRRVLHVPVAGLEELAGEIAAVTAMVGEPPRERFLGHITLARNKGRGPLGRFAGGAVAGEWTVDHFDLIRSSPGPEGSAYETVERFSPA